MRYRHLLAATTLLAAAFSAHAEHFEYQVDLTGTYSAGGTDGCYPPDFNQPACPQPGSLTATLSFDTPSSADGSYMIAGSFGDITDFYVSLGDLPEQELFGGVNVYGGVPNGTVQSSTGQETFTFDWATRSASYVWDYGDHDGYGNFTGILAAVPEPSSAALLLLGLAGIALTRRKRMGQAVNH